jgi:ankyrin repeat protein
MDGDGKIPLHLACKRQDVEMVKVLLGYGSECQSYDVKQRTPLHLACTTGNVDLVQTLTLQGAKSDVTDTLGRTPVHYAADRNQAGVLEFFIERGIDVTTEDATGMTPLALAQEEHSLEAMATLSRTRPKTARVVKPRVQAAPKGARSSKTRKAATLARH